MKIKSLNLFLYISLISIGIIVGVAIRHYYNLPISESINIVDLATLVATIFLAVYIPEVLDRQQEVTKSKKKLIEQRIDELQILYRRINMLVQSELKATSRSILVINNTLDIITSKLSTIETLVLKANLKNNFSSELNNIKTLSKKHRKLLWVDNNLSDDFNYSPEQEKEEEVLFNKLDEATSLLIFKISES